MRGSFLRRCLALTAVVACLNAWTEARPKMTNDRQENEDIAAAELAILSSLVVRLSEHGASLCIGTPVACVGPDRDELALSLIGARNTPKSLRALAALVRFGLAGGPAENHDELVVTGKGPLILPALRALNPEQLNMQCKKKLTDLMKSSGPILGKVKKSFVYRSPDEIKPTIRKT